MTLIQIIKLKWLAIKNALKAYCIYSKLKKSFPGIEDKDRLRIWVFDALDDIIKVAEITPIHKDEQIMKAIRKVVERDVSWKVICKLIDSDVISEEEEEDVGCGCGPAGCKVPTKRRKRSEFGKAEITIEFQTTNPDAELFTIGSVACVCRELDDITSKDK